MSMEKNGAISSNTPNCCGGGSCSSVKQADDFKQRELFPMDIKTADNFDRDLTKAVIDAVKTASTKIV